MKKNRGDRIQHPEGTGKRKPAKEFQDLIVWQKAHQFVLNVYQLSDSFPKSEIYGLTSQIRRSAVSVPANIAEGFKKKSKADKARFMNIARDLLRNAAIISFSLKTSAMVMQECS